MKLFALTAAIAIFAIPAQAATSSAEVYEAMQDYSYALAACEEVVGLSHFERFKASMSEMGLNDETIEAMDVQYQEYKLDIETNIAPSERRKLFNNAGCARLLKTYHNNLDDLVWKASLEK